MGYSYEQRADTAFQAKNSALNLVFKNGKKLIDEVLKKCEGAPCQQGNYIGRTCLINPDTILLHIWDSVNRFNNMSSSARSVIYKAVDSGLVYTYNIEVKDKDESKARKFSVLEVKGASADGKTVSPIGELVYVVDDETKASVFYHKDDMDNSYILYIGGDGHLRAKITQDRDNICHLSLPYKAAQNGYKSSWVELPIDSSLLEKNDNMIDLLKVVIAKTPAEFKGVANIALQDLTILQNLVPESNLEHKTDLEVALLNSTNTVEMEQAKAAEEIAKKDAEHKEEIAKKDAEHKNEIAERDNKIKELEAQLAAEKQANKSSQDIITSLHSVIDSIKGIVAKIPLIGKRIFAQIDDLLHSRLPAPAAQSGHSEFVENLARHAQQANGQEIPASQQPLQQNQILDGQEFDD